MLLYAVNNAIKNACTQNERLTVIRGRGLTSAVRRTDVGDRAAVTTRLLLHGLHGNVDTVAGGIVDPG